MATILLASNDAGFRDILEAEILAEGFETVTCLNGVEVTESALASVPMLALLDTSLEIFNGIETCAMLRSDPEIPNHMPIYLVTDDNIDSRIIEKCGATGLLKKTHGSNEIRDLLARHIGLQFLG